jgi:hypothetical protein
LLNPYRRHGGLVAVVIMEEQLADAYSVPPELLELSVGRESLRRVLLQEQCRCGPPPVTPLSRSAVRLEFSFFIYRYFKTFYLA